MCRLFDEIVQLDRRWFRAHPERRHRCRLPDTGELRLYATGGGARLVIAIRHLGHGHLVYQPMIIQGVLPKDERSAAVLFALAARDPAPIPEFAAMDVRPLAHGGPLGEKLTVAEPRALARERGPEQDPESLRRVACVSAA
jgi:hypothetical protein